MKTPEYLGRYKIGKMIGHGGMGVIYSAKDDLIGREVAIKIIDISDKSRSVNLAKVIERQFEQEMRISGQLSNHNVVTIYDAGSESSFHYLVMELLDGTTIDKMLRDDEPGPEIRQKLEILIQIGQALHYAHQRGIVHRDIKPSNIMALNNGQVKIMDFGVAYAVDKSDIELKEEQLNIVGGTPYYMSPEQINRSKVDSKSDLFSLGVVAYEFLTGKRPFTAKNRTSLYEKILRQDPTPIKELVSDIPDSVASIITVCLNKDPDLRLASCQAFADQLDEILNESFLESEGEAITQETINILKRYRESFAFFYDLSNAQIYKLLHVCQTHNYKEGDVIFEEGSVARNMYLIISGKVKISRKHAQNDSVVILFLKQGDVFGEMGIVDGGPRSASVIAETDCKVLSLHQVSLLRCDEVTAGKIYRNLATILSTKLRITAERFDDFSERSSI